MKNRHVSFGALPPPGRKWMVGKTVEEITAIAEEAKATNTTESEVASGDAWKKRLPQNI